MGLMKELVLLPVAPVRGAMWVANRVAEEVDREQFSEGAGVQQLDQIQEAREHGALDHEDAASLEEEVVEQQLTTHLHSSKPNGDAA